MNPWRIHTCSICGDTEPDASAWFLVRENHLEDKVQILHWNDRLADRAGVHAACSAAHVQEIVVHWMTTGSLGYPFALVARPKSDTAQRAHRLRTGANTGFREVRPIGELAVDRESMKRVLYESPHSLRTILDALLSALQRPAPPIAQEPERQLAGTLSWEV